MTRGRDVLSGLGISSAVKRSTIRIGPWHFGHSGITGWPEVLGAGFVT